MGFTVLICLTPDCGRFLHTGDRSSRTSTFPGILFLYLGGLMEINSSENPELSPALISEILISDEEEATEDYIFG